MIKMIRFIFAIALVLGFQTSAVCAAEMKGKTLYTQVNMHSYKGKVVTWVNYNVDAFIPVNTPVEVISVGGWSGLKFKLKDSGLTLKLKNNSRHSGLSDKEWAEKHFGERKVNINRFSKSERNAIEAGEVKVGMSKGAILVARGYPPAHKTPSLKSSSWLYWNTKWNKVQVIFGSDDKVSRIRD